MGYRYALISPQDNQGNVKEVSKIKLRKLGNMEKLRKFVVMEKTGTNGISAPEGKRFTAEYQPPGVAKSEGWKRWRAEKMLTQKIIEKIIESPTEDKMSLNHYVEKIYELAVKGNPKAIDTINNGIEEAAQKIELPPGSFIQIIQLPDNNRNDSSDTVKAAE